MREFQDIYIVDLNEKGTRRNFSKNHLFDFKFRLSAPPPTDWQEIFGDQLVRERVTRKALAESKDRDEKTIKEIYGGRMATIGMFFGSELTWTARERDLEKQFKILEKCIKKTNQDYTRLVNRKLDQSKRDQLNTSHLRSRLFGKTKR